MKGHIEPSSSDVRKYYDDVYYSSMNHAAKISNHLKKLSSKLNLSDNEKVLDVACGVGQWLLATTSKGCFSVGIDISVKALKRCKVSIPDGLFCQSAAEKIPFKDAYFDFISCLGALEHFLEPDKALQEMVRVGTPDARFLFLVPNSDFLTAKLGLYKGTDQTDIKEESRTLVEWEQFFLDAGLVAERKWKDLHVLNWRWISAGSRYRVPFRALQALLLVIWPLKWQYQVYFLCKKITKQKH